VPEVNVKVCFALAEIHLVYMFDVKNPSHVIQELG
jgi:hypothetical protein